MLLQKNGISYDLSKQEFESDSVFYQRMWFIVNQEPKNEIELETAIHLSILWANMKYLNCYYGKSIKDKIRQLEKKIVKSVNG